MSQIVHATVPADPTPPPTARAVIPGRFTFIDALRGIAAISVVIGHAFSMSAFNAPLNRYVPGWLTYAIDHYAARGVQIFFVISGFVIAHSIRNTAMSARGCSNFILRRQLRLDPPYWTMILASFAAYVAGSKLMHAPMPDLSAGTVAANLFYLQKILGRTDIIVVGWTLAIEIQFYIAFLTVLVISRQATASKTAVALLIVTALAALATDPNVLFEGHWAVHTWPYFASGVLCYWAYRGQIRAWPMAVVLAGLLGSTLYFGVQSQVVVGVGTTLAVYAVGKAGRLHTAGNHIVLQFLGRISYSLYLSHMLLVLTLQQLSKRFVHSFAGSVGLFVFAIAMSICVAYVFYRLVERPSMRWATRFKEDRGPSAATGFGTELPPRP